MYETSSDEEEDGEKQEFINCDMANPNQYQQSLKYIENFYTKYAPKENKDSNNELSYQDELSIEPESEINEEII